MYNSDFISHLKGRFLVDLTPVLLAAGNSTRLNLGVKKQWLRVGDEPLWLHVAKDFKEKFGFKEIIIVANSDEIPYMRRICDDFTYCAGGSERQISLSNALNLVKSEYVLVSDVARAQIPKDLIARLVDSCSNFDCVSPVLGVFDTAYLGENLINRNEIKLIQTPQISKTALLKKALLTDEIFSDDSSAVKSVGGNLGFIKGDKSAFKITEKWDLKRLNLPGASAEILSGNGYDVHKLQAGTGLVICGIRVPCEFSFVAHSDGDVAIHALIDAILGAAGLGDIGEFYPDSDAKFKGINSEILLSDTLKRVRNLGFKIINADVTIIAQKPKISAFKAEMARNLARILGIRGDKVNVKATTTEKLGFTGRAEGIAAIATANLGYFDWKNV